MVLTYGEADVDQAVQQRQIVRVEDAYTFAVASAKGPREGVHRLGRVEALLVERCLPQSWRKYIMSSSRSDGAGHGLTIVERRNGNEAARQRKIPGEVLGEIPWIEGRTGDCRHLDEGSAMFPAAAVVGVLADRPRKT